MIDFIILGVVVYIFIEIIFICFELEERILDKSVVDLICREAIKVGYFPQDRNICIINLLWLILPYTIIIFLLYKFIFVPLFIRNIIVNNNSNRYNVIFRNKLTLIPAERVEGFDEISSDDKKIADIYLKTVAEFVDTGYTKKDFLKRYQSNLIDNNVDYIL